MAEGPITRTCKSSLVGVALGALLWSAGAAEAKLPSPSEFGRTYVVARAAELSGDHDRSAQLLAQLAEASGRDTAIHRRAASQAITAGAMGLALRLGREMPADSLTTDVRLLLAADELLRGQSGKAQTYLTAGGADGDLSFIAPFVAAWDSAERRNLPAALTTLEQVQVNSLLGSHADEQKAYILLKFRMTQEAETYAVKAISQAARRETQMRLALADGFRAAGDRARALKMLDSPVLEIAEARARINAGKSLGTAVDTPARAFAELLSGLSLDLMRVNNTAFPVRLLQVARYASPNSSPSALVLGAILQNRGRTDEALAAFRTIRADDLLASQARDAEARALTDAKRFGAAYVLAKGAADRPGATSADHSRFGDVLMSMKRYGEAAAAYQRALDHPSEANGSDRWTLLLLKASASESANQWPQAKSDLETALKLAPEQPMLLNFLGYAKLERGEDLDAAEAMIRKASDLAPDDASITDSLGWAQYKRGKIEEAVETLQRAAVADPSQAEIREHLGDALFDAGRKFEARFAWEAALVTADEEIGVRVKSKLASGLDKSNRAP